MGEPPAGFELPRRLVEAMATYDPPDARRRAWVAALPGIVDDLAWRWELRLGRPFQPGGAGSWVAPAADAAGEHLVLKVGWRHGEALHEAEGLRVWDGRGSVRCLDALTVDDTSALLLEACEPGTPLARVLPPAEQDVVVSGLLRRVWIEPPPGHPFRPLAGMCAWWAEEFEDKHAAAGRAGAGVLDAGLAREGIELFRELPATAHGQVLLCTDLHPENVLAARREPWLVIDPKPYVGDPAYDLLQHMLNFPERLAGDPGGFADRMAGLCEVDGDRVRQWLFARCVQESVDQPYLRRVAAVLAAEL